jgi:hypothetical protein
MKDKLLTYAFIFLMVFALFAYAWPIFRDVTTGQVNKVDDNIPNVTISELVQGEVANL